MYLRKKHLPVVPLDELHASLERQVAPEYRDDDRRLTGTIDRINLNLAIAQLPRGYRTAFVLFEMEGYEHREIARMQNWSVGNSRSQLHKARRKLRQWLLLHGGEVFPSSHAPAALNVRRRTGRHYAPRCRQLLHC